MDEIDFSQFYDPDASEEPEETIVNLPAVIDVKSQAYEMLCKILDSSVLASIDEDAGRRLLAVSSDMMGYSMPDAVKLADEALGGLCVDAGMFLYLFLADKGFAPGAACRLMGINKTDPVIWRRSNRLFAACQKSIIEAMADEAEAMAITLASTDPKSVLERMFVIKAHKPQYRDNAGMPAPTNIQLNVTVDLKTIDPKASYRVVNEENNEE